MTSTKLLIDQIVIVSAIVLSGIWLATQCAAAALAYQPELGTPWFHAFGGAHLSAVGASVRQIVHKDLVLAMWRGGER